jgi:crossover junction endodeoxyribonuclease RusA
LNVEVGLIVLGIVILAGGIAIGVGCLFRLGVSRDGRWRMIRLILPPPVSSNRYWRIFRGRVVVSAEAKTYRAEVAMKARAKGIMTPLEGPVSVHVALCPEMTAKGLASKTRLDLDNCIKVALDALQGVAFANDKQVVKLIAEIGPAQIGGALMVEIEEVGAA